MKGKTTVLSAIAAAALAASIGFFILFIQNTSAQSPELRVFISDAIKPVVEQLHAQIERAIGCRLAPQFEATKALKQKIESGEAFDVAFLASDAIEDLIKQGKMAPGSRTEIARDGVGVGIRAGAAKPDISTPEALKRTLLAAKFISSNPTGASAPHIHDVFERLGIAENVKSKIMLDAAPGGPQRNVAQGKADLVLTLISEIKTFPGVELAGPIPGDLQSYVNFAAGIAVNTRNAQAAKALVKFMSGPVASTTMKANGLDPR